MGSRRGKRSKGGGGWTRTPFCPRCWMLAHLSLWKQKPPHAGCLGDGSGAGSSSRRTQRAMGEGAGRKGPPPPQPPGAPPPFFWALLGGRDRVSGRNNTWRRGPWLGFSPTLFISAIKDLDTVGWRSHRAWGQLGDSIRLTRRAADGCCPRPSGHRGAQGIVSVRRGRHPAGRQWGMGTAHTLGSKLRGKGKGGWGRSGGKEDPCPTVSPPVDLHHEHPKHVTSPATLSLGGLSPARLSPQPHAEHHALPPPCCHPPCCPSSQRRAKPLLHHPQVLAPSRPGPSLSQYQDRDLLLLLLLFKKKSLPGRWGRAGSTAQVEELEMVPSALPSPAPAEQRRGLGAAARHRQMRRKTHFSNSEVINY